MAARSGSPRVAVFGSASWNTLIQVDTFPEPGAATIFPEAWHETIGSSGAGAAMNLARLGIDVVFHCPLGVDLAGDEVRLGLSAAGVVVDAIVDPAGTARHVNLMNDAGGRMSFQLHTGDTSRRFNPDAVEPLTLAVDHVVVAIVEQARDVTLVARRLGRPVWTDLHDTDGERRWDRDFLEADAIFFSDQRLPDPRPFMKRLIGAGRQLAVCTRGDGGAIALTADGSWIEVPAEPVDQVVDTNGAGDAFLAGTLAGELHGLPIDRSLRIGARVAALSVASTELASPSLSPATIADLLD
jgi:sugar/nucleoside kinase (ribokinase family)